MIDDSRPAALAAPRSSIIHLFLAPPRRIFAFAFFRFFTPPNTRITTFSSWPISR
jgi:hypothetical protein